VSREALKPSDADNDERKLLIARHTEALEELKERYQYIGGQFEPGDHGSVEELTRAAQRLLAAELELYAKPVDQVAVRVKYLDFTKNVEEMCKAYAEPCEGVSPRMTVAQARVASYQRLEAELELLRAKRKSEMP